MTLLDQRSRAAREPADVRDIRRRAAIRLMLRVVRRQRERLARELGYVDLGGEAGGA